MAKKIFLLYETDAWLSNASHTLLGVFSTFEKACKHLRKMKISKEKLEEFKQLKQTQGHNINYKCIETDLNPDIV